MRIDEKIDIKGIAKKLKGISTGTLLAGLSALSPTELQTLQTIINTAFRAVAEGKDGRKNVANIKLSELLSRRKFWKINEATKKIRLKPKELGEGVPVDAYFDDENYLVLRDKEGKNIFLHPYQVKQLHNFLMKNKIPY